MADQAPETGNQPVSQEPAQQPPAAPQTPAASPQSSASKAPAGDPPSGVPTPQQLRELKDGEEPADDSDRFAISSKAFKERMARAQRRILKDILGVDDPKEAKKLAEKYKALEKEKEERRLAEMSERDREKERRRRLEREYHDYKKQVHEREVKAAVNEVENVVVRAAKTAIRDKSLKHAIRDFQEYVGSLNDEQAEALYNENDIGAWFTNYAKEYEVGKDRDPVDEPLNVGAGDSAKPTPTQPKGGLDLSTKGGKSKKEVNEWLKKQGSNVRL